MQKKVSLVTGGAGFIGSHVVKELLKMRHNVVILDDLSGGFKENVPKGSIFAKGSINDEKLLEKLFKQYNFDFVYHIAAYAAEGLSHFIRKFNYENNLIGSINLINLSIKNKVKHFVFTSSIAVYGKNQTPMTENLTPKPEDPYGIAKYAIELDLKSAYEMFGLTYTIFRPHNVYGEGQNHGDPYRNVLGIFVNNIMMGKPMTIFGSGKQTRAFSYIADVSPYIAKAPFVKAAKNQIINIGADKPYTILTLAKTIAKAMNIKPEIIFLSPRKEVEHAFSDHSKAKNIFLLKKTVDLVEGVSKMVKWAKKIGPRKPKKFGRIEIAENLPPSWKKII